MSPDLKVKLIAIAKEAFVDSIRVKASILEQEDSEKLNLLTNMSIVIANSIKNGGKLLLCGNGGSAADAQHLAAELLVRFRSGVERKSLPAIALTLDASMLTATANDYNFEQIFARPLSGLGKAGDVLLGITTSGNSKNVLNAFAVAKAMDITTLGFLGGSGGLAKDCCDYAFIVPSSVTARIQEVHITAGHIMMEIIEQQLIAEGYLNLANKR